MVLCDNFKVHPRELGIRKNLNEDSFFIENYIKEFWKEETWITD